jgi:Tfp pilus assembly protein PilO
MLLFLQATISQTPLTTGLVVILLGAIGIFIQWITFAIMLKRWRNEEDKLKEERQLANENVMRRVCKEYTSSTDYINNKEKRIRELAQSEIADAFSQRAESFVDAKEYKADRRHIGESVQRVERQLTDVHRVLAEVNTKLTQIVLADRRNNLIDLDDTATRRRD